MVHQAHTQDQARRALVNRWTEYERDGVETGIETFTNKERVAVNALAREAWKGLGRLSGPDVVLATIDGATPYAVGDRVVIRGPVKESGLHNGSVGTFEQVEGGTLYVKRRAAKIVPVDTREHPKSNTLTVFLNIGNRDVGG